MNRRKFVNACTFAGLGPLFGPALHAQTGTVVDSFVKYDYASWHYGGDFPEGLPETAGGTHMGMYLA